LRLAWLQSRSAFAVDAAIAVAVYAASVVELYVGAPVEGPRALNLLALVGVCLPLALRRRAPLPAQATFAVSAVVMTAFLTALSELTVIFACLTLIPYGTGSREDGWRAWAGLVLAVGAIVAIDIIHGDTVAGDFLFPGFMTATPWFAGRIVRQRARLAAELHEQAVRAQERREEAAREAVGEERRRIAREMHDVVAHSVSVMVVQAGGARRILDADPDRALAAAGEIERAGREALGEMRRLLGVLRPEDEQGLALAPQPTLASLDSLVARAEEAGLPVTVAVEGTPRPLKLGLDLAAYRIVQEGLTNAIKHAGAAPTAVRVSWQADALVLEVADRGPGPAAGRRRAGDGGHGLVGMRERVRLYGGELETGAGPGGGFLVRAVLPLERKAVLA
jgi:signal transduction histidine kinase